MDLWGELYLSLYLCTGKKAQRNEDGGCVLLDDNAVGGAVMRWPIRFQCVVVRISTGLPCVHTHTHTHTHIYIYI